MATDMEDNAFAAECRAIADTGRQNMVTRLFDGEYFINRVDPNIWRPSIPAAGARLIRSLDKVGLFKWAWAACCRRRRRGRRFSLRGAGRKTCARATGPTRFARGDFAPGRGGNSRWPVAGGYSNLTRRI